MDGFPILTILTFLPILGAIVLLLIDKENYPALRLVALVFSLVEFVVSLPLFFLYEQVHD